MDPRFWTLPKAVWKSHKYQGMIVPNEAGAQRGGRDGLFFSARRVCLRLTARDHVRRATLA